MKEFEHWSKLIKHAYVENLTESYSCTEDQVQQVLDVAMRNEDLPVKEFEALIVREMESLGH